MASRASVESYRKALDAVAGAALDDLNGFMKKLSGKAPADIRDAMLTYAPSLARKYGSASAELALRWYISLRTEAGVLDRFTPEPSSTIGPEDAMVARVKSSAVHLFPVTGDANIDAFTSALVATLEKQVRRPAHETIVDNSARDRRWKPKFALIAHPGACRYCVGRSGLGAFYKTDSSAKAAVSFHGGTCRCVIAPVKGPETYPKGYNPEALREQYRVMGETKQTHADELAE